MNYRLPKKFVQKVALMLLCAYRDYISYFLPSSCRFYPSCSHYSYEAIKELGLTRGGRLTLWRILRCHPWSEGGFDPVPARTSDSKTQLRLCCDKHHYLERTPHTKN